VRDLRSRTIGRLLIRTASLVLRGTSVQLAGRAIGLALSLVTVTVTVRYLGASGYGELVTVVAFAGLFETFADLGVGTVIVRRVTGGAGSLERLIGLNLGMSLIYAAPLWLVTAAAGLVVYAGRPAIQLGVAIVAVGLIFRVISTSFVPIYWIAVRWGAMTAAEVVSRAAALALTVVAIQSDAGVVSLMGVQVVPPLLTLILMVVISRRRGRFRPLFGMREALSLFREAVPLAGVQLVGILYYRADGVLLSVLSSTAELGAYGLGYRLAGNAAIIATVFADSAFSTMTRAWAKSTAAFNNVVSRSMDFILLCTAGLMIFGIALGPDLLRLIAPDEFAPSAATVIQLLFAAIAVGYINTLLSQALIAAHQQRYLLVASPTALVFNIALNLILIPAHGAVGAAVALASTEVVSAIAGGIWLRSVTGGPIPARFMMRLLLPITVTIATLLVAGNAPLLVQLVVLSVTYPASVFLTGLVKPREVKSLLRSKRHPASSPAA
jgi:O-antigen/teichoic acid export membrane protein